VFAGEYEVGDHGVEGVQELHPPSNVDGEAQRLVLVNHNTCSNIHVLLYVRESFMVAQKRVTDQTSSIVCKPERISLTRFTRCLFGDMIYQIKFLVISNKSLLFWKAI